MPKRLPLSLTIVAIPYTPGIGWEVAVVVLALAVAFRIVVGNQRDRVQLIRKTLELSARILQRFRK